MVLRAASVRRPTRASRRSVDGLELSTTPPCTGGRPSGPGRHVDHFELEPIRVLEEDRVVARPVFWKLPRGVVKRGHASGSQELVTESVHVLAPLDTEGEVIEAGALAVEASPREGPLRRNQPDIHRPVGERDHPALVVDDPPVEISEEVPVERSRAFPRAHVDLQMVEPRRHATRTSPT